MAGGSNGLYVLGGPKKKGSRLALIPTFSHESPDLRWGLRLKRPFGGCRGRRVDSLPASSCVLHSSESRVVCRLNCDGCFAN